jgi:predicted nuclease of predicted toxin-antitoxin system
VKLLLDENLSDRIIQRIIDLYPDSEHVKTLGLINTDDAAALVPVVSGGFHDFN